MWLTPQDHPRNTTPTTPPRGGVGSRWARRAFGVVLGLTDWKTPPAPCAFWVEEKGVEPESERGRGEDTWVIWGEALSFKNCGLRTVMYHVVVKGSTVLIVAHFHEKKHHLMIHYQDRCYAGAPGGREVWGPKKTVGDARGETQLCPEAGSSICHEVGPSVSRGGPINVSRGGPSTGTWGIPVNHPQAVLSFLGVSCIFV